MAIEAVIFDMDGVLIDTEEVWEEVRQALTLESGGTWLPEAQRTMMGMSSFEWSSYMAEELRVPLEPDEISRRVVERMIERYAKGLPVLPGAVEAVRAMGEHWPLAVASSANRPLVDAAVDILGLVDCFQATVSSEEVEQGKPHPDVYNEAARRLGVDPRNCGAVEDSSNGLRSAHAAGMRVIAIPNKAFPPVPDALELATLCLASLYELTPEVLEPA